MSRRNRQENLSGVQLFPFIAVLLCTIGSLLVVLVGVAQSARKRGAEEAATAKAAAALRAQEAPVDEVVLRELERLAAYRAELEAVRSKAAEQLRQDQGRLSHLEDHMRRLRDQLESLKVAAAELNAREGEHYDDREQATREIERLEQLIVESRKTIDELRDDMKSHAKSYAIVPYQGRRGTSRRPIYIECLEDEVILQPEGIRLTIEDFQPPIGPGNPLVAAIRAAREHLQRQEASGLADQPTVPYPLIIVRPSGVKFYYLVREAIQSWDSEFGYELVEEDWELRYAPADPQLAVVEYQAVELSRNRLRALAAAAPQAFGAYRGSGTDGWGSGWSGGGARGAGGYGNAGVASRGTRGAADDHGLEDGDDQIGQAPGTGTVGGDRFSTSTGGGTGNLGRGANESQQTAAGARNAGESGSNESGVSNESASARDGSQDKTGVNGQQSPVTTGPRGAGAGSQTEQLTEQSESTDGRPATRTYTGGSDAEQELDAMARAAASKNDPEHNAQRSKTKVRGKNWAIRNADPGMIPIRRTIQVVVRDDVMSILAEASAANQENMTGSEFKFADGPPAAYEALINAVDARIDSWGMAGKGLYWRPVVELKVVADGNHRVDDLMRLLQHSGIEVRGAAVAQHAEGGIHGTSR